MATSGRFHHWLSLLLNRFSRRKNLGGEYTSVEASAIPTLTMLANWAKNDRTDISEIWVFGSAVDHEKWNLLSDDLDILMIVPDKLWKPGDELEIPKEAPLSDQYLRTDIRVRRESECEPWLTLVNTGQLAKENPDGHKPTLIENIFRYGACVWRREDDN